jgi:hypothetical protein
METPPAQVQPESPTAFPVKAWLLWFFTLLVPPAGIVILLVPYDLGLFDLMVLYSSAVLFFLISFALLAATPQWIYLRRKVRRAAYWLLIQGVACGVTAYFVYLGFNNRLYLLTRNFPMWVSLGSFCLILLVFLLPGALLRFSFFRARKVPVGWGWFRDHAVVFALGLCVFLIYDWFTEGRPAPIPGLHGALYTGMITFFLCLAAGEAWVLARVPFPGLAKKIKKGKAGELEGGLKSVEIVV